ncbi:hypothetical protein [Spiroplasma tabanidicola]|uniref:Uncharacterized protein n=1 Tax=Spiroplasma tabanidicola TaxID=324079 RepID=A0A6I6CCE9_9MOLU|nr:hypothetical protein [Spiroplasma tabanidicola]QGS51948.1 hypothetical protein STABA_v1c05850 [Spiroplasma tabanidicola]
MQKVGERNYFLEKLLKDRKINDLLKNQTSKEKIDFLSNLDEIRRVLHIKEKNDKKIYDQYNKLIVIPTGSEETLIRELNQFNKAMYKSYPEHYTLDIPTPEGKEPYVIKKPKRYNIEKELPKNILNLSNPYKQDSSLDLEETLEQKELFENKNKGINILKLNIEIALKNLDLIVNTHQTLKEYKQLIKKIIIENKLINKKEFIEMIEKNLTYKNIIKKFKEYIYLSEKYIKNNNEFINLVEKTIEKNKYFFISKDEKNNQEINQFNNMVLNSVTKNSLFSDNIEEILTKRDLYYNCENKNDNDDVEIDLDDVELSKDFTNEDIIPDLNNLELDNEVNNLNKEENLDLIYEKSDNQKNETYFFKLAENIDKSEIEREVEKANTNVKEAYDLLEILEEILIKEDNKVENNLFKNKDEAKWDLLASKNYLDDIIDDKELLNKKYETIKQKDILKNKEEIVVENEFEKNKKLDEIKHNLEKGEYGKLKLSKTMNLTCSKYMNKLDSLKKGFEKTYGSEMFYRIKNLIIQEGVLYKNLDTNNDVKKLKNKKFKLQKSILKRQKVKDWFRFKN